MKTRKKKMKIKSVKYSTWSKKFNKKQKSENKPASRYLSMNKKPSKAGENYLPHLYNLDTELAASSKGIPVGFRMSINFKGKMKETSFFAKIKGGALELTFILV